MPDVARARLAIHGRRGADRSRGAVRTRGVGAPRVTSPCATSMAGSWRAPAIAARGLHPLVREAAAGSGVPRRDRRRRAADREVAVMCASHNGEPVHLGAVRALLERAGLGPEALRTPPSYPLDDDEMARPSTGTRSSATARASTPACCSRACGPGGNTDTYPRRSHPLQRRVLRPSSGPPTSTRCGSASTGAGCRCTGCRCVRSPPCTRDSAVPERLSEIEAEAGSGGRRDGRRAVPRRAGAIASTRP